MVLVRPVSPCWANTPLLGCTPALYSLRLNYSFLISSPLNSSCQISMLIIKWFILFPLKISGPTTTIAGIFHKKTNKFGYPQRNSQFLLGSFEMGRTVHKPPLTPPPLWRQGSCGVEGSRSPFPTFLATMRVRRRYPGMSEVKGERKNGRKALPP